MEECIDELSKDDQFNETDRSIRLEEELKNELANKLVINNFLKMK